MLYYFILGQNPALSITEILSVLPNNKLVNFSREVLVMDMKEQVDVRELMGKLGGCIKIGKVELEWNKLDVQKSAEQIIDKFFDLKSGKKVFFGFSTYFLSDKGSPSTGSGSSSSGSSTVKNLAKEIKSELKQKGVGARWVISREKNLSSVVVAKNKLLTRGAEICLLVDGGKIYAGKTLAVQAFAEYSNRDYGRKHRDTRSGMIPPKLAKMMINLSGVKSGETILDPFCGSGTIVQEGVLMGYEMVGSDISAKAVTDSKENLAWLVGTVGTAHCAVRPDYKIFQCDARNVSSKIPPQSINAIVAEPYLGPPLRGNINEKDLKKIMIELSDLYLASLQEFKKVLRKEGRVVMVWPVWRGIRGQGSGFRGGKFLSIMDDVKKLGYQIKNSLPDNMDKGMFYEVTDRGTIAYGREGQRVMREIVIMQNSECRIQN